MTASSLNCCALAFAWAAAVLAALAVLQVRFAPYALPGPRAWGAAALAALAVGWACGRWFRRRLGGVTGDTLGAAQQFSELAVILAVLAMLGR